MVTLVQAALATLIVAELYVINRNFSEKRTRETESKLKWVAGIVSRSMSTGKTRKNLGSKKFGGFSNISRTIKKANNFSLPQQQN